MGGDGGGSERCARDHPLTLLCRWLADDRAEFGNTGRSEVLELPYQRRVALHFVGVTSQPRREALVCFQTNKDIGVVYDGLDFATVPYHQLVFAEAMFITVLGGGAGLLVAWLFVLQGDPTGALPQFVLRPSDLAIGVGLTFGMGILAGAMPAIGAMRLRITDALRR